MWMNRSCVVWLLWTLALLPRAGVGRYGGLQRHLKLSLRPGPSLLSTWGWTSRTDWLRPRWAGLLVAFALLTNGCASLTPPPGRESNLGYMPRGGPGPTSAAEAIGGAVPHGTAEPGRQSATLTRQAVFGLVDDVKGTTVRVASALSKLAARPPGLGNRGLSGVDGAFTRYLDYGSNQLPWLLSALGGTTMLTNAASEVADSDMELGILQMTGPRLQAAMFSSMLLAVWLDFLQLADIVL
jgi:hypothetical protein